MTKPRHVAGLQGPVVAVDFFPYRGRHPGACSRSLAAYASGSSSHNRGPTCRRTHISVPDVQVDAAMAAQDPEYRDRKVHR